MIRALALACAALCLSVPVRAADRVVSLNLCTDQWLMLLAPEKAAALSPLARDPSLSFVANAARAVPSVRASAEAVLALHPDLVLGTPIGATAALALLEESGVRVERIALPADFAGIRATARTMGDLLGVPDRAGRLIAGMDARMPAPGPARRAVAWEPRGLTAAPGDVMHAALRQAGMEDLGAGRRVGVEALVRLHPDLLAVPENTAGASLATEMLNHPSLRAIPVRAIPMTLTLCPIPASVEAVRALSD